MPEGGPSNKIRRFLLGPTRGEKEEMDRRNPQRKLTKGQHMIRIVAGAYLLYLVYKLFVGMKGLSGKDIWISVGGMVLFTVAGILLVLTSGRAYARGDFFDPDAPPEPEEFVPEDEAEKAVPEPEGRMPVYVNEYTGDEDIDQDMHEEPDLDGDIGDQDMHEEPDLDVELGDMDMHEEPDLDGEPEAQKRKE